MHDHAGKDQKQQLHSITLVGRHEHKLGLVASSFVKTVAATATGHKDVLAQLDSSFDVVVEASGSPQGMENAVQLCRPLGTVVLKTTCAGPSAAADAPLLATALAGASTAVVVKELQLVGSRCGPFKTALGPLQSLAISLLPILVTDGVCDRTAGAARLRRFDKIHRGRVSFSGG